MPSWSRLIGSLNMAKRLILRLLGLLRPNGAPAQQSAAQTQQRHLELYFAASKGNKTALNQLRVRAEQGNVDAQFDLGFMYQNGDGVPKDSAQAAQWYRKAAEQGLSGAQNSLGVMYANGNGVPKDSAQAAQWYRKAAEQDLSAAQFNLGLLYDNGDGVPKELVTAYMWFSLVAGQGIEPAKTNRDSIEKLMTANEIAEAQRLSREWKPKGPPALLH